MALFEKSGLPHRRVEEWKYTDLRALMKGAAPLADGADDATLAALTGTDPFAGLDRARLVVVNGTYRPDLSDLAGLDGVTVTALAEVLAKAPERVGRLFADSDDTALALNSAFMQGGVVVDIAKDARPARPIEIVHLTAAGEPVAVFVRDMVTVGANASVRIVDTHRGPDGVAYQVNAVTELSLAPGAHVEWARLQAEGSAAQHIGTLQAKLSADVTLRPSDRQCRRRTVALAGFRHRRRARRDALLQRRHHADRQRARRPDAGRAPRRGLVDEPRAVQERGRRQGRGRLPGPHRRRSRRAEDRRQDDGAGAAPVRRSAVRLQAGAGDLRRRRPVRPRLHLGAHRRHPALLPDGARRAAARGRAAPDRGLSRRRHRHAQGRSGRRRAQGRGQRLAEEARRGES